MDSEQLQKLAQQTRSRREAGYALLAATAFLSLFFFIPAPKSESVTPIAEIPNAPDAFAGLDIKAGAAIVYDLATDKVLYEKNADAQLPLASLTKLLTVYAALASLAPDTPITISPSAIRTDEPHAFNEGQTFALSDIAKLTLTASLNDGAAAIAEVAASGQNISQVSMLAGAAASLDLAQTYAVNGSGLDMSAAISGGYGSARDMAVLAGALVEKSRSITSATTQEFATATSAGGTTYRVKNTDPIIGTIPGLLLSKTGFTSLAGGNLAIVFDAGIGHQIAIIVLGSSKDERFSDTSSLVNAALAHFAGVATL